MMVDGTKGVALGQSSDHFATISPESQLASRLSLDDDDKDSGTTLGHSPPQRPAGGVLAAGCAASSSLSALDGDLGGRIVRPPFAAAPSSLRLAEMRSGAQFPVQRFYSSAGSWIFPGLFGSCFRPMWNNLFPTRNEPSLTSLSSEGSGDGRTGTGLAKSAGLEVSLEQIDVNFKEDYIGGGNQSSVFRGKFNGRYIALKKLNRVSEVNILTLVSLDHVNIIKTIGVCTRDVYPIIAMEYCERGGLFDVIHKVDVTKTRFLQWAGEIVDGIRYLHSRKIVHRDLKSPNILVNSEERLKICDFGSLYAWEKTYMPSVVMSVCGTSQWMSPEMLKNEPCNEKVDVWSFGVVLWELLTQEVPYKNISPMAIMYGVGSGQLKLHVPKSVPPILEMLFGVCWARRPRNRPSFVSIATHLANLRVSLAEMSEDAWQMQKNVWRREICEENAKRCVFSSSNNAKDQKVEELIVKRRHELRHLQELRTVYERKAEQAERYTREVFAFYEEIRRYEAELMQRELEMFGENRVHRSLLWPPDDDVRPDLSAPATTNSNAEAGRRCRFRNRLLKMKKSMIVQMNDKNNSRMDYNNCSNKLIIVVIKSCGSNGKLSVDDNNDPEFCHDCPGRHLALAMHYPNGYDYAEYPSTDELTLSTDSSASFLRASDDDEENVRDKECGRIRD